MIFYGSKMDVVRFATEVQQSLEKDLPLTTITRVGKSEVYSVSIVTDGLSEDTVENLAQTCSLRATVTSSPTTLGDLEKTVRHGLSLAGKRK